MLGHEAEEVGTRLAIDPARTVERLRKTPQGCDWLMRRWALLAHAADRAGSWTAAQTALAFDLLAVPEGFRDGAPGKVIDGDGRADVATKGTMSPPAAISRKKNAFSATTVGVCRAR